MAGEYGVQYFHDAGTWERLSAYQHLALETAQVLTASLAENLYAYPFGVRITGPKRWVSDRIGGRQEIELNHNPVTEEWTGKCTKCSLREASTDVYAVTIFARKHEC
ncbi:hypothetical protein ACWD7Y_04690 [Streptomyces drozdowiczii]